MKKQTLFRLINVILILSHALVFAGIFFAFRFEQPEFLGFSIVGLWKIIVWQNYERSLKEGYKK